jgi:hypothetical protein|tara:strand:+ start:799 stop:2067 length:1269 start_codon:yes stop_codon:yes gene_type:complete
MSELEKTIEELEKEVLAELEEAEDPTKKGAAPAAKAEKIDTATPGGEVEDGGAAVVSPDQGDSPAKKLVAKAKEISGDKTKKAAGKADAPEKLAAGDEVDHDGEELVEREEEITEKEEIMEAPKTKKAMIQAMVDKMEMMKAGYMKSNYDSIMSAMDVEETSEPTEEEKEKAEAVEARIKDIDVKEDVRALMSADDSLSEDFKIKAATIFEAAVKSKVRSEIERIHEEVLTEKEGEIDSFKDELAEKVDTYLNYVVEEWTKENELAIERGLKGEIAEDFISGLKQLFEDHYIDVPDEKYDVLEAQSEKISELEDKLNESIEKTVELTKVSSNLVREQVISEVSEDLADTEIEKFKSLTEDVDFTDEESFRVKLNTLKDSYFPKTVVEQTFDDEDGSTAQDVDTTDAMSAYLSAISRNQKASA